MRFSTNAVVHVTCCLILFLSQCQAAPPKVLSKAPFNSLPSFKGNGTAQNSQEGNAINSSGNSLHPKKSGRGYIDETCQFVQKFECYCRSIAQYYWTAPLPCKQLRKMENHAQYDQQYALLKSYGVPFGQGYNTKNNLAQLFVDCSSRFVYC